LMSKAGTKLDDVPLQNCIPIEVKNGQKILFGLSTRTYQVSIDYSKMQKAVEIEKRALEREMRVLERLDKPGDLDLETLKNTLGLVKEDTVYVSNLPYSCTEKDLRELFGDCGQLVGVRIPEDWQTKKSRGFAFITFDSEKAAKKALNYDGHKYYDRKLHVQKAEKRSEIEEQRVLQQERKPERRRSRSREEKKEEDSRHQARRGRRRSESYGSPERRQRRERRRQSRSGERQDRLKKRKRRSPSSSSSSSSSSSDSG